MGQYNHPAIIEHDDITGVKSMQIVKEPVTATGTTTTTESTDLAQDAVDATTALTTVENAAKSVVHRTILKVEFILDEARNYARQIEALILPTMPPRFLRVEPTEPATSTESQATDATQSEDTATSTPAVDTNVPATDASASTATATSKPVSITGNGSKKAATPAQSAFNVPVSGDTSTTAEANG